MGFAGDVRGRLAGRCSCLDLQRDFTPWSAMGARSGAVADSDRASITVLLHPEQLLPHSLLLAALAALAVSVPSPPDADADACSDIGVCGGIVVGCWADGSTACRVRTSASPRRRVGIFRSEAARVGKGTMHKGWRTLKSALGGGGSGQRCHRSSISLSRLLDCFDDRSTQRLRNSQWQIESLNF